MRNLPVKLIDFYDSCQLLNELYFFYENYYLREENGFYVGNVGKYYGFDYFYENMLRDVLLFFDDVKRLLL